MGLAGRALPTGRLFMAVAFGGSGSCGLFGSKVGRRGCGAAVSRGRISSPVFIGFPRIGVSCCVRVCRRTEGLAFGLVRLAGQIDSKAGITGKEFLAIFYNSTRKID